MATITQRTDRAGQSVGWQAKIRRKGYPTESRTFATKREAEAWARGLEGEMDQGVFVSRREAESTTLTEALDRYEREITPRKKGASQEKHRLNLWRSSTLATRSLAGIRGTDLAKWRDARLKAKKSPTTVNHDLMLLSSLFTTARREWGMESLSNPVEAIKVPSLGPARERRFQDDEEKRLMAALDKSRFWWTKPIVQIAIETGMRQGEILGLEWERIDLKRRVARLEDTKNGTAREVPLSSVAAAVLDEIPRAIKGPVFPVAKEALIKSFRSACDAAEIQGLRFHDLRHEALSRLSERGFGALELATIAGHRTLNMVRRYVQLRAEDLAKRIG